MYTIEDMPQVHSICIRTLILISLRLADLVEMPCVPSSFEHMIIAYEKNKALCEEHPRTYALPATFAHLAYSSSVISFPNNFLDVSLKKLAL